MAGEMGTPLNGASKTSSVGSIAQIAIPLLLSLFGSKKASPQAAAKTTAEQNALALSSLPPEIRELLNIQTQNAKAAQPIYLNALNAQNQLLPSWARGGGASGGATPSTVPSSALPAPGTYQGGVPNVMGGAGKTPMLSNDDSPFSGAGVDNGLVPGNSLDPQTVMTILGLLTGNPMAGGLAHLVKKPATTNTNFTLT